MCNWYARYKKNKKGKNKESKHMIIKQYFANGKMNFLKLEITLFIFLLKQTQYLQNINPVNKHCEKHNMFMHSFWRYIKLAKLNHHHLA